MADAAGSSSVSFCNSPSPDDHHQHLYHYQLEHAAKLPEYSQQPIDGIDTRAEV